VRNEFWPLVLELLALRGRKGGNQTGVRPLERARKCGPLRGFHSLGAAREKAPSCGVGAAPRRIPVCPDLQDDVQGQECEPNRQVRKGKEIVKVGSLRWPLSHEYRLISEGLEHRPFRPTEKQLTQEPAPGAFARLSNFVGSSESGWRKGKRPVAWLDSCRQQRGTGWPGRSCLGVPTPAPQGGTGVAVSGACVPCLRAGLWGCPSARPGETEGIHRDLAVHRPVLRADYQSGPRGTESAVPRAATQVVWVTVALTCLTLPSPMPT
jgi:hypothetical protein